MKNCPSARVLALGLGRLSPFGSASTPLAGQRTTETFGQRTTVSRPPKCNCQPFRPGHGTCNGSSLGRARKSGYCPRSTRPPAALARAPVDDVESESRSRSRAAAARGRASPSRAPAHCWRLVFCGHSSAVPRHYGRSSLAIMKAAYSIQPYFVDRGGANAPCIHICPWCSPALGLGTSRNSPFGSASTPLGAPEYVRTDDYTLPATQRLGLAE
eukprot:COSAG06_NODE_21803_length_744_cov_3.790698_1_plen_214_part_00